MQVPRSKALRLEIVVARIGRPGREGARRNYDEDEVHIDQQQPQEEGCPACKAAALLGSCRPDLMGRRAEHIGRRINVAVSPPT